MTLNQRTEDNAELPTYVRMGALVLAAVCLYIAIDIGVTELSAIEHSGLILAGAFLFLGATGVLFFLPLRLRKKWQFKWWLAVLALDAIANLVRLLR
ncbi:hypothetical protein [Rhodoferax saidenbachensis]|uniref:Uncharacterized protein n=1 Tax=Rhodoferax saidenbachensis TaxID=1484693 RepID=A0ABU1ZIC2_9BURK|nr:hypothetical protein [Rhodoferax saidenbachensis]MDR7305287.1 hypothetical protein [Rhodoferax saidenbachensis]